MNFRPLGNRILVKQNAAIERTAGGLYIPETSQVKPLEGTVIAVGPLVQDLTVNDGVIMERNSAIEISLSGETYLIVDEKNVLGSF